MIDLRFSLPESLQVDGKEYPIYTDYRIWIEQWRLVNESGGISSAIFKDVEPSSLEWVNAALEFLAAPCATPKRLEGGSNMEPFDFILDGDYIFAAFLQAYGIRLTTASLHWHEFLALFRSLPEQTKMSQIMGYRTWSRSDMKKKQETIYQEQHRAWKLPPRKTYEETAIMGWQNDFLGGAVKAWEREQRG